MSRSLSLAVVFCCSVAAAMSVRTTVQSMAKSADGAVELVELDSSGPEGGGSLVYEVRGPSVPKPLRFVVSDDMSPGDGSTPQRVSKGACEKALAELLQVALQRGISGVVVHPDACAQQQRGRAVTGPALQGIFGPGVLGAAIQRGLGGQDAGTVDGGVGICGDGPCGGTGVRERY